MDILNNILKVLPEGEITSAGFEGANIVLYTANKNFFLESESLIRDIVNNIKKRVELRADQSILEAKDRTEEFIRKITPTEAGIEQVLFDEQRSLVTIEAKKPGLSIGKEGKILKEIKEKTFWIPVVRRSPIIRSLIIEGIRDVLYKESS